MKSFWIRLFSITILTSSVFSAFAYSQYNMALGDVASNIVDSMSGLVRLITAISYVAGMGFALAGIIKFKSHRDNPTQVTLSAPIVLLAIGTCLLFLPNILQTAGTTVFGQTQRSGTSNGFTALDGSSPS